MHVRLNALGQSRTTWLVLFLLAVGLRLGFAALAPRVGLFGGDRGSIMVQGSDRYEKIARQVLAGNGYRVRADVAPTMLRNPVYVGLVTAVFHMFGDARIVGYVLQALTSGLVVLLIGVVGRPVVGPGAALIAGLIFALYPPDWVATAKYAVEPLLAAELLLALLALRLLVREPSIPAGVLLGAAAGLLCLTKSVAAYLLPFLLVWMLLWIKPLRARPRVFLPAAAVALIVNGLLILPWGIWNHQRSGHWVFTSTVVGWALFDAHYENLNGGRGLDRSDLWQDGRAEARRLGEQAGIHADPNDPWLFNFYDIRDEYRMGELLKRHSVAAIRAEPLLFLRGVARGLADFWYSGRSEKSSLAGLLINLPLLILAIQGLWTIGLRHRERVCWVGAIVYMNLITALSMAVARYAIPVIPLIAIFAGAGAMSWMERRSPRARVSGPRVLSNERLVCDAEPG